VPAVVASWLLLVADELPIKSQLPSSVPAQMDLLRKQLDWIGRQDWVDDFWREMTELHKALKAALHDHEYVRMAGGCYLPDDAGARCGGALIRRNGDTSVKCSRCSNTWAKPYELARLAVALEMPEA
jgi:hypothetical protein